jgi:hypothetical protein
MDGSQYMLLIELQTSDWIQICISALLFGAIVVALFGERFWRWMDRPKIEMDFDRNCERCFRKAVVYQNIIQATIQETNSPSQVERQYYRLRVLNRGGTSLRVKAKVELLDAKLQLAERFEPCLLRWVTNEKSVDLAPGEDDYVNLLSEVIGYPEVINRVRIEIADMTPRGIGWDRQAAEWVMRVSLYGSNIREVVVRYWKYIPTIDADTPGNLEQVKLQVKSL